MKRLAFLIAFSLGTQSSYCTHDGPVTDEAVRTLHTLQNIVLEAEAEKKRVAQAAIAVSAQETIATTQLDLKLPYWQDTFFRAHQNSGQHFLICGTDKNLFKQYLGALIKLLQVNNHIRVTFVVDEDRLDEIRRKLYVLIRSQVRGNHLLLRNLHVISRPFDRKPGESNLTFTAVSKDKYSAIFLACPRTDYSGVLSWLRNQNAMLYIPYDRDPDDIVTRLKHVSFVKLSIVKNIGMVCAATTDQTKFLLSSGCLCYNPSRCPPIDIDEVTDNLVVHDCRESGECFVGKLLLPSYDRSSREEVFSKEPGSPFNNHL